MPSARGGHGPLSFGPDGTESCRPAPECRLRSKMVHRRSDTTSLHLIRRVIRRGSSAGSSPGDVENRSVRDCLARFRQALQRGEEMRPPTDLRNRHSRVRATARNDSAPPSTRSSLTMPCLGAPLPVGAVPIGTEQCPSRSIRSRSRRCRSAFRIAPRARLLHAATSLSIASSPRGRAARGPRGRFAPPSRQPRHASSSRVTPVAGRLSDRPTVRAS